MANRSWRGEIAEQFVLGHLLMQNGGIRTKYNDEKFRANVPGGSDVLSESQGLFMRYALLLKNEALFSKALSFVEKKLAGNGVISYRYSSGCGTFPANAAIDDFRIIRALLDAAAVFEKTKYRRKAQKYSEQLAETNIAGLALYDFYEPKNKRHNSYLTLCYADFKTMLLLSETDARFKKIGEPARRIVEKGFRGDAFPLFATSCDYRTKRYKTARIETIQSLITAIHLAEINACPKTTVVFVKEKVMSGTLYGLYNSCGKALNNIESTAVYALASILGGLVRDEGLKTAALTQMQRLQITDQADPLYGAFGDARTQEVYSFDNLCALIAFEVG